MNRLKILYTITGILILKAVYGNNVVSDLIGFWYIACLIFSLFIIVKLLRLLECLITGKGNELIYSNLPEHQQIDVVLILNKNRLKN